MWTLYWTSCVGASVRETYGQVVVLLPRPEGFVVPKTGVTGKDVE